MAERRRIDGYTAEHVEVLISLRLSSAWSIYYIAYTTAGRKYIPIVPYPQQPNLNTLCALYNLIADLVNVVNNVVADDKFHNHIYNFNES